MKDKNIINQAREFLDAGCPAGDKVLRQILNGYQGDFAPLVHELKPKPVKKTPKGWQLNKPFQKPSLALKYPHEQLTYYVPPEVSSSKPVGLVLYLHGGGKGTPRDTCSQVYRGHDCRDLFENCGRVACFPCAPYNAQSFASWNLPCVEPLIEDVIEEMEYLFPIDPHDMILGGFSMGAIGVFHLAQRIPDRFASFFAGAGGWDYGNWPVMKGTRFWIAHGINDAILFKRRHGTDIEFSRIARQRLVESGVEVEYRECSGPHWPTELRPAIFEWLEASKKQKRDPFHPHVVAVTPRGCTPWFDMLRHPIPSAGAQNYIDFHELPAAPHCRWITIHEHDRGTILFDTIEMGPIPLRDEREEDWNAYSLKLRRKHIPGALVEAVIRSDGVIEIAPLNVTRFSVWLHPSMVDFKDVRIIVKGKERHRGPVKPSLVTLLESYHRRRDWGMLYPAKLEFEADESWATGDQLMLRV